MAIDKDLVVRTALRMLDREGLERLSLRRIAAELDVKAPALYWHFESKRALLDHMADAVLTPALPDLEDPGDAARWPDWLAHTADLIRSRLLAHPDGAQLALGADLTRATALLRIVERTVEVLHHAGFGLADASRAAASFLWFVVGRTVEEQTLPDPASMRRQARANPSILSRAMAERTAPDDQDVSFRFGVRIMVAGMRALIEEERAVG
ncbi:TetR/AcrR family transcriptional regulator C-terminal domain-containing protein [Rugosimonospora acidiphila]|uniref:TetR/AcrR family transcriptional regulator C-terminal domain-containing protein n=1 Tax=Rugosimonospora acidiphila TaxID=556531 RepID=A0ABP9RUC2_9ACTN